MHTDNHHIYHVYYVASLPGRVRSPCACFTDRQHRTSTSRSFSQNHPRSVLRPSTKYKFPVFGPIAIARVKICRWEPEKRSVRYVLAVFETDQVMSHGNISFALPERYTISLASRHEVQVSRYPHNAIAGSKVCRWEP